MIPRPKCIILIVIDTLRADHLSYFGYRRRTTPFLDDLCRESVTFKYAFSTCSYTIPSHASVFTGKYPHKHSVGFSNGAPTRSLDEDLFVTEILSDVGYETGGFVSSIVLGRENGGSLTPGFKIYNDCMTGVELNRPDLTVRLGKETTSAALQWLDGVRDQNFFLFLHYFDVHGPYVNPSPYDSIFVNDDLCYKPIILENIVPDDCAYAGIPSYQVLGAKRNDQGEPIEYEKDANFYIAQYDGGIRYVDDCLGLLFSELKKRGLYDDSLIIVTSDHGEALGEHNVWFFHGLTVTLDQVHVPLVIKPYAGLETHSKKVFEHVSLADIFPTVCELVGFDYDHLDIDGHSLLSTMYMDRVSDSRSLSKKVVSEIEGQIAYIDSMNMHILPRKVDSDRPKYFVLEHLSGMETSCPYRFEEADGFYSPHRDFIHSVMYDIAKASQSYRYQFASQFVQGCEVLSLFCGDFHGLNILSLKAKKVMALSPDKFLIDCAREAFTDSNLTFSDKTLDEFCKDRSELFDVIICILDFSSLDQIETLFCDVKRMLRRDGIAVLSLPNTSGGSGDPYRWNPRYFESVPFSELYELCHSNFHYTYWFQQETCPTFRVTPLVMCVKEGCGDEYIHKDGSRRPSYSKPCKNRVSHFVAVCSQSAKTNILPIYEDFTDTSKSFIFLANDYIQKVKTIANQGRIRMSRQEAEIDELKTRVEAAETALKQIEDSDGWKLLTKCYEVRDSMFPQSSAWRRVFESVRSFLRG